MEAGNRKFFRILLIDDDPDLLALINGMLTAEGYANLIPAYSGGEALATLHIDAITLQVSTPIASAGFDLILLDYALPDINGNALCDVIKSQPVYQETPIVILTASDDAKVLKESFDHGASDFIRKPIHHLELVARVHAALRIKQKTQQLRIANDILRDLYTTDPLTNLNNRGSFDQRISREWKKHLEDGTELSVIMIDVDYFKAFNDSLGHQAGDNCLIRVGNAILNTIERPRDFVARYGGEEFVVLLAETDQALSIKIAEKIRAAVAMLGIKRGPEDHVTVSSGAATVTKVQTRSVEDLLREADLALYAAKKAGRNRVVHFENIQR